MLERINYEKTGFWKIKTCAAYREEHVLLVLIDSARVRHGVSVFDHRHRFTYEDVETVVGIVNKLNAL